MKTSNFCHVLKYSPAYSGECNYSLIRDGKVFSNTRNLGEFDVLIREPQLAVIVSKVLSKADSTIEGLISADTPFGIPTNPDQSSKTLSYPEKS